MFCSILIDGLKTFLDLIRLPKNKKLQRQVGDLLSRLTQLILLIVNSHQRVCAKLGLLENSKQ